MKAYFSKISPFRITIEGETPEEDDKLRAFMHRYASEWKCTADRPKPDASDEEFDAHYRATSGIIFSYPKRSK